MFKIYQFFIKFFFHPEEKADVGTKKIMNLWTLTFINQDLEEKYSNKEKQRIIVLFRLQYLIHFLINVIYFVNNQFFLKNYQVAYFRVAFCFWHIICMILQANIKRIHYKSFIAISEFFSCVITILIAYVYVQAQLINKPCGRQTTSQAVSGGIQTGLLIISYLLVCPLWFIQGLILIAATILFIGLMGNLGSIYWTFYVLLLMMLIFFRFLEYYKRIDFYTICQQTSNLHACKNIFDKTVPNSILILTENNDDLQDSTNSGKEMKLIYSNDFAIKYLQVSDENEIIKKLKSIYIQTEQESEQDTYNSCVSIYDVLYQKMGQFEEQFTQQLKTNRTTVIQNEYDISDFSDYFLCFRFDSQSKVALSQKQQLKIKSHFEIRVLHCIWENKHSILVIMNDISEKIRLKHLKELDQYKDRLLATVSHDLKTPLNGMMIDISIMQNILQQKSSITHGNIEQLCGHLDEFNQSGQLLLSMINDLLDYSQINKGYLRLIPKPFNLNNTFKFINSLLLRQSNEKGVQLIWRNHIDPDHSELLTDENRLKQVLINLVANAIKFTMQGEIVITANQSNEKDVIEISVSDTGYGIPEDIQKNLFRLYSTFDIGNNNRHGVGLGLTISQQLVTLLGPTDKIDLKSQVGKGSTFKFIIFRKLQQSLENSLQELDLNEKQIVPRFPSYKNLNQIIKKRKTIQKKAQTYYKLDSQTDECLKVLIVDDTPFNIIALSAMLNQVIYNCKLYKAFNGKQAFDLYSKEQMSVIFMDVNMPEMDGYQCTQEIRKFEQIQRLTQSLIIIVTAFTGSDDKQKSQKCGANDHLDKPLNMEDLKKVIKKFGII
ncbi:unnamed protein product (macronuclear) [Paramecium tetraurelia]|uniref:Uncharacterized protein n=1 Tax=Paramecium tetraurelia TaxID=5888 RepID=A0DM39_PARTE|nr:uncharacterized protein GSPATT00018324001 [Paramecium tetraurelia]CAK84106.1 unnamed protein product [Paramecium tetraurelia]|eukprot:XP_001451503.1 hypothetical protein (macronuclear) [Paramecium tetraurelia strain d4-2]